MRKLKTIPDPVLKKPCDPVTRFDKTLNLLYLDLIDNMIQHHGIGIAAPQVGVSRAVCIVNQTLMVNPQIIEASEDSHYSYESCLSVPGESLLVKRPKRVIIQFQDLQGKTHTQEFKDYFARVCCHEIDHLNAVLITDRQEI